MDVDDFLRNTDLPSPSVDAEDALVRTRRRGGARRRRRTVAFGVGSLASALAVVVLSVNLAGDEGDGRQVVVAGPGAGTVTSVPDTPEVGDPAVWRADRDVPPSPGASTFTALVTRLGCHSGETGQVLRPGVVFNDAEVVVTFTVEADRRGFERCPSNLPVSYEVDLGQPLGDRALVDGSCLAGGAAVSTTLCGNDGVRWRPVASGPVSAGDGPVVALVDAAVTTGAQGNERVTFSFSGRLRQEPPVEIAGWPDASGEGIEYLIQPMSELLVCGDTHWFPTDTEHSIDLLLPVGWFDTTSFEDVELRQVGGTDGGIEKVIMCPPRNGVVQISFWGMGPTDQAPNVSVIVGDGGRSIVVENT